MDDYEKDLKNYRNKLQELEIKSSSSYDKAILTLSGGAIAISLTFVKSFTNIISTCLLSTSWILWSISIVCMLSSFVTSQFSIRKAINHIDDEKGEEKIFNILHYVTLSLNIISGISFIIGTFLFLTFSIQTITEIKMPKEKTPITFDKETLDKISSQVAEKVISELEKKGQILINPPKRKPNIKEEK